MVNEVRKEYSDQINVGESLILWRSESLQDDDYCVPGYRLSSHRHFNMFWSLELLQKG